MINNFYDFLKYKNKIIKKKILKRKFLEQSGGTISEDLKREIRNLEKIRKTITDQIMMINKTEYNDIIKQIDENMSMLEIAIPQQIINEPSKLSLLKNQLKCMVINIHMT